MRLDRPDAAADIQAAPVEFRPIPIDTPDGPWVGNHTHTGLVLRPFGSTQGYRFDNGAQAFGADWRSADPSTIVAVFTNDAGAQSTQRFDLTAPRVDLGSSEPVPAPPDPQPPIPEPPVSYPPQIFDRIDVVKGVDRDYPGLIRTDPGGFCDQVAWRLRKADSVTNWGRKRKNDGSFNDDVVTWRIGPTDAQKHLVDTIAGDARVPVWDVRPQSEEPGNGTWASPRSDDRDAHAPDPGPTPPSIPTPDPTVPTKPLPTYHQFVDIEGPQIEAVYREATGHPPNITDMFHNAYARLVERWTLRDLLHRIRKPAVTPGELEDGGAGGDLR